MDFRHLIVTCLFSKLRLPFDNQKVKENYAIFSFKTRAIASILLSNSKPAAIGTSARYFTFLAFLYRSLSLATRQTDLASRRYR